MMNGDDEESSWSWRDFVLIRLDEGFKALRDERAPEANGCRRYVTSKDAWHSVSMTYCSNPACPTTFPTPTRPSLLLLKATTGGVITGGVYGVCLCGATASVKLSLCSQCRNAQYCCKACQKQDWKEHKLVCGALRQQRETEKAEAQAKKPERGAVVRLGRDWRGMDYAGLETVIMTV